MSNRQGVVSLSIDWDNVIRNLADDKNREFLHKDYIHPGHITTEKSLQKNCTKSAYSGQWNAVGMQGIGNYTFPYDVEYEGKLRDGMFHGEGTLTYPMGQKFEGVWNKGDMIDFKYNFWDGLEYNIPWNYCQMPDRRFYKCIEEGLRPAGRSLLINEDPCRRIPKDCYDTTDGYYNPKTKCVMSAISPGKIIRIPTKGEEMWIKRNCRKAWDEPTGYRPDLYEHWVTGRRSDSIFLGSEESPVSTSETMETDKSINSSNHAIFDLFAREEPESFYDMVNE